MVSRERLTASRIGARLGLLAVVLAAATLLIRLPAAFRTLGDARRHNDGLSSTARRFNSAADSVNVDNAFTLAATEIVPPTATYAIVLPPKSVVTKGQMADITYDAVAGLMLGVLLPRRPAPLREAAFVLCYQCGKHVPHVRWTWMGSDGSKIGRRAQ